MAFIVESKNENGFNKIILKDSIAQSSVEILPSCGAILHAITVLHKGSFINVIEQYSSVEDFADNVEAKGFKSCKLSPFACRLKNATYHFGETQYTVDKFLMGESAIHGLLYDAAFEVTSHQANEEEANVVLSFAYKGTNPGYPFCYDCNVTYTLKKENRLHISTEVINKDKGLIPVQDGWHPYFTLGGKIDDLQLEFQGKEKIIFDDGLIPNGETIPYHEFDSLKKIGDTFLDNCFSLNFAECQPLCVLRNPVLQLQLEVFPDTSYPYLQLYTPPHRNSIAIENLSAIPDAFNNGTGLITLAPQTNAIFSTAYKITPLN
jgi:aldose 1-epimerase